MTLNHSSLDGLKSALMVGIGGAGMKALAEYLLDDGWTIRGTDSDTANPTLDWLRDRGIRIDDGFHSGFFVAEEDTKIDLVIRSAAVSKDHPEVAFALQADIPVVTYNEMLGAISRKHETISVAGTHGKSTTASLTAHLLSDARRKPSAIIGAELKNSGRSGWKRRGQHLILESCEYRRSFLSHDYRFGVILNIESDHFDYFTDRNDLHDAFREYASHCRSDGLLLISPQYHPVLDDVLVDSEIQTFSTTQPADWTATDIQFLENGSKFDVRFRDRQFCKVRLKLKSRYFLQNTLAAVILAQRAGLNAEEIEKGLETYPGLRRRFEILETRNGVTFVDDYAHHPTEIRATLETARLTFPKRRLICIFQPHQVSRTSHLKDDFIESLAEFDSVILVPVFAARENRHIEHELLSQDLVESISHRGTTAVYAESLDHLPETLEDVVREGDVVILMGAGDLYRIQYELTGKFQRNYD